MIYQGDIHASSSLPGASMASFAMTDDNNQNSIKGNWGSGSGSDGQTVFFKPDEVDIYCNKKTLDVYIFHAKDIDYSALDYLEYNHANYSVNVVFKNGRAVDLGVKIQWLVRPYFSKAQNVYIVKTKDNKSVDGTLLSLIHKGK